MRILLLCILLCLSTLSFAGGVSPTAPRAVIQEDFLATPTRPTPSFLNISQYSEYLLGARQLNYTLGLQAMHMYSKRSGLSIGASIALNDYKVNIECSYCPQQQEVVALRYLDLPILYHYKLRTRKISYSVFAGPTTSVLLGHKASTETWSMLRPFLFSATVGVGASYETPSKLYYALNTVFKHSINSIEKDSDSNTMRKTIGVELAVGYKF